MAFALLVAAPIGASLSSSKIKPGHVIAASTFVAAIGLYMFSFLDPKSTALDIIIPMVIMAFGLGFGMSQRTSVIASVVPQKEIGVASSLLALARNIAGAFGIAIFSTILNNATESNVLKLGQMSTFKGTSIALYQQFIALIELKAQVSAYGTVFLVSSLILVVGAILALFLNVKRIDPTVKVHVD